MNDLIVLPLLIPMLAAVGCLLAWGPPGVQKVIGIVGSVCHLAAGAWLLAMVMEHGVLATAPATGRCPSASCS